MATFNAQETRRMDRVNVNRVPVASTHAGEDRGWRAIGEESATESQAR